MLLADVGSEMREQRDACTVAFHEHAASHTAHLNGVMFANDF